MARNRHLKLGRDVILFFEDRDRDTFVRGDRRLRRILRKSTWFLRPHKQRISGFEMSFNLLRRALEEAGQTVHVNAERLARRNPDFPVGICGYPHILDRWTLPNPAVLGPGLFDHPKQAPALLDDPRFRSYLAFSEWMADLFARVYDRARIDLWFGGIDPKAWPDTSLLPKDIDVLVYDKIRWNRETLVPTLLDPILQILASRGLRIERVRYGAYTHERFQALLARSRSMLFLCEHETQGMAYQEAMASGVPILAWDQGYWLDPNRDAWESVPIRASSVPYFAGACGERFVGSHDFEAALDRFLKNLAAHRYAPRSWVVEHLSMSASAQLYLRAYAYAGGGTRP